MVGFAGDGTGDGTGDGLEVFRLVSLPAVPGLWIAKPLSKLTAGSLAWSGLGRNELDRDRFTNEELDLFLVVESRGFIN